MTDPRPSTGFRFFRFTRSASPLASASCALVLAAIAAPGCGSSDGGGGTTGSDTGTPSDTGTTTDTSSGDTAKGDTGGDGVATDTGTPGEGGADTGTSTDGASDASGDAGPPPFGTKLAGGDFTIKGVTTDGYVIVQENVSNALQAIPLAGGAATTIDATFDNVQVRGKVVFSWHAVDADGIGALTTWTAASGPKAASTKSFPDYAAASDDAALIAFIDAADASGTGNLVKSAIDATGKTTLTALDLSGCDLDLRRAGARFLASYCADSTGTTVVASWDGTGTKATLLSDAAFFSVDDAGTKVFVASSTGAGSVVPIAGGTASAIDTNVAFGAMRPDGTGVVYRTQTGTPVVRTLKKASADGTAVTTLVATGFGSFASLSPNGNSILSYVNVDSSTSLTDLFLVSAVTAGTPTTLNAAQTSDPFNFGSAFTTDSSHVVFSTDVSDTTFVGTLKSAPVAGGTPTTLSTTAWFAIAATGAKVVFTDGYTAGTSPTPDRVDLRVVDTSTTTAPTVLQSKVELDYALNATKDKVVYTYTFVDAHKGLYVGAIP